MTIREILTAVKAVKPGQYEDPLLIRWLGELEMRIWQDILCHYGPKDAPPPPVPAENDPDRVLQVAPPHDDIYVKWLCAQIDYHNAEFDRYNNGVVAFNAGLQAFADWYNRAHMPRQDHYIQI